MAMFLLCFGLVKFTLSVKHLFTLYDASLNTMCIALKVMFRFMRLELSLVFIALNFLNIG